MCNAGIQFFDLNYAIQKKMFVLLDYKDKYIIYSVIKLIMHTVINYQLISFFLLWFLRFD